MATLTPKQKLIALGEIQFPKYVWYLYACIIAAAGLVNVVSLLWARWRRHKYTSTTTSTTTLKKGIISTSRLPAAILAASRVAAFRWRIPAVHMTLLEVLLTITYIVVLACLEFTMTLDYNVQIWGNRAGHLATIQFPLIVALSGKNNVIGIITGLSHENLNLLHRMVSRVLMCLVWIHCAGTYVHWLTGAHRDERPWIYASWIVAGFISCIAQTILVFFSWGPIRRRFYESFYMMHMVLIIIILVCTMYHVHMNDVLFDLYASPYIWPSFLVWGIDRGCRLLRVLLLNSVFKPQKDLGRIDLITRDTLLITIKRHIPHALNWHAGQHMFVSFPTLGLGQSHPFTMASIPRGDGDEQELTFIARVRNGLTKTIKERILEHGACEVPVILDGPYGAPADITPFSTCVFVAGGSGVTYTLPRFEELISALNTKTACARRIVFIWAIRERTHMRWIVKHLAATAARVPSHVSLSASIYITSSSNGVAELTGDGTSRPPSPSEEEDVEKTGAVDADDASSIDGLDVKFDRLSVFTAKPDVKKILEDEVGASEGPVSVDVSGPDSLLAATRSALSSGFAGPLSVLKGAPTVQLNVEAFSF
ncbi:hypothetical protein EIP91_001495 [Steccherinum ochraceum]|uniref:ferric-chelate reductase (NADPH) n=1 Tax=Steccherinum ochraceum TaxID=92696 RepID=A0A4R0RVQ1_9APHY|nr:hypothetical protein EIP91_001495 [Steccherinum ochraceum]